MEPGIIGNDTYWRAVYALRAYRQGRFQKVLLSGAEVAVSIVIAPALKSRLVSEVPLFVFAREPGSQGPPLAAKRLTSSAIGTQVHLSPADSMLPGRVLSPGQRVSVTARVSFSGQAVPAAGDLYGELSYDVGRDGVRTLTIDRVAE